MRRGWVQGVLLLTLAGCDPRTATALQTEEAGFATARLRMVEEQILARGITHPRVLEVMRQVPRHAFVPSGRRHLAYTDQALPIGYGQTISQPLIVAFMTASLDPQATDRVLEIGTGSGYQAAVLAGLVSEVYSLELVEPLGRRAEADLQRLGYRNVHVRIGDGYLGWPEAAPFDVIIVTCAPDHVPRALVAQLKVGGRMIVPVGPQGVQELILLTKRPTGVEQQAILPVRFVPMVRE